MQPLRTWTIEAAEPGCCLCISESRIAEKIVITLIDRHGESTISLDKEAWEALTTAIADFRWAEITYSLAPKVKALIPNKEWILPAAA